MTLVADAIARGELGACLWLYSNYHCNLACSYCLTESSPRAARRQLDSERMLQLTREAADLGFTRVGVAGGEPFMRPDMPEILFGLAGLLPVIVLTNGTLFSDKLLERLRPAAKLPITFQVSLDSADAERNDSKRESGNFAAVIEALPRLRGAGLKVRIATTGGETDPAQRAALCALHKKLGIDDDDHVVRPIVNRGRAVAHQLGVTASAETLPPELTITVDGAFWSPFAPTVSEGRLDIDLLVSRTVTPLRKAAEVMVGLARGRPAGSDATLGIR
jgi:MoaA/NifB/PqqE/SkfB family radical SAM enzyme